MLDELSAEAGRDVEPEARPVRRRDMIREHMCQHLRATVAKVRFAAAARWQALDIVGAEVVKEFRGVLASDLNLAGRRTIEHGGAMERCLILATRIAEVQRHFVAGDFNHCRTNASVQPGQLCQLTPRSTKTLAINQWRTGCVSCRVALGTQRRRQIEPTRRSSMASVPGRRGHPAAYAAGSPLHGGTALRPIEP